MKKEEMVEGMVLQAACREAGKNGRRWEAEGREGQVRVGLPSALPARQSGTVLCISSFDNMSTELGRSRGENA